MEALLILGILAMNMMVSYKDDWQNKQTNKTKPQVTN